MKKIIYLFALLSIVAFTSCGSDKEDVSKYSYAAAINNRAVDGNEVVFSQCNGKIELNYTTMTIQVTADFKDLHGTTHTVNTAEMKLTPKTSTVYQFSGQINGVIDLTTGMMCYTIAPDGSYTVYASTQLVFPYLTTTVTEEDGRSLSHENSGYVFALDSKGETAVLQLTNYVPDAGGAIQASLLEYSDLAVTPTTSGYHITADEAKCKQSDFYDIHDLDVTVNITEQFMNINGSFKIKDHTYQIAGLMFKDMNH